jgi:hypothetical protein
MEGVSAGANMRDGGGRGGESEGGLRRESGRQGCGKGIESYVTPAYWLPQPAWRQELNHEGP